MKNCKHTAGLEDILRPDGSWCYRYELHEYSHKSDDYLVYNSGTNEYTKFLMNEFKGE